MNKFLLPLLFIFSIVSFGQENEPFNVQNMYLQELIESYEDNAFGNFDIEDKDWRKSTIEKLTSSSNIQENSFLKTAMILHMLRYKLGDDVFYSGIENYKNYLLVENKEVDILDFQYFLENESNEGLTYFFNDWFKSKGHPSYVVGWFQNQKTNEVSISIKQNQSDKSVSFFELPLPIKIIGENNVSQLVRLEISENGQNFNTRIPFIIKEIEIDPDHQLITRDNSVKIGIDQEVLNKEISLFPNPAIEYISVRNSSEAAIEKVSIYNMLGKLIIEEKNPTAAINLKPLSTGVHLVKIETSQGTLHKTILKK